MLVTRLTAERRWGSSVKSAKKRSPNTSAPLAWRPSKSTHSVRSRVCSVLYYTSDTRFERVERFEMGLPLLQCVPRVCNIWYYRGFRLWNGAFRCEFGVRGEEWFLWYLGFFLIPPQKEDSNCDVIVRICDWIDHCVVGVSLAAALWVATRSIKVGASWVSCFFSIEGFCREILCFDVHALKFSF